ncbi:N-acetylmuramoyl-L-alanine amidase [Massilia glaciei]|uniref:N-acetylmuramoyl-L-alanine amidase n=1 Tax=Massilia glaciei TaxID=1524097 RepID=A0A2U2HEI1_9BURK|nr:N-acetylmuramoyl-L-alanine amidase [Massilia glaciei]PWF42051.1 N-acetylmuramoyl-L-alanine amidase [Massilia glaciei]
MNKILCAAIMAAMLGACASPPIDRSYSAASQGSRVKFLILHYTVGNFPSSLKTLTQEQVSSHYLVSDGADPVIYGLVDESQRASHAGNSQWKNFTDINSSSVGIEIVNPGYTDTPEGRVWYPFPQAQIDLIIALSRQIIERHKIAPENVLGHSDIAPQRKQDPGKLFPWDQLAKAGLVKWPDAALVADARLRYDQQLPDVAWFQKQLAMVGYAVPQTGELDPPTRTVLGAFQMKYRPATIDGAPDAETAAMLEALTAAAPKRL